MLVVLRTKETDMDYEIAKQLIKDLRAIDAPINAAIQTADGIDDTDQRREIRRTLARVLGTIYTDLMVPIAREFPDLLPKDEL